MPLTLAIDEYEYLLKQAKHAMAQVVNGDRSSPSDAAIQRKSRLALREGIRGVRGQVGNPEQPLVPPGSHYNKFALLMTV